MNDEQLLNKIFIFGAHAQTPFAAAALQSVFTDRTAFNVSFTGKGHYHVFYINQFLDEN